MEFGLDTAVAYGNACETTIDVDGETLVVTFAPDPHGGPETLWFRFRLRRRGDADPEGDVTRIRLVLKHAYNMLGGNDLLTMRPVVRTEAVGWKRLPMGTTHDLADGRSQVAWTVDAPEDYLDIAYCYPYGMDEIELLLEETDGYWRPDTIGASQSARPLVRLSNSYGEENGQRPGLYLLARQHAGEVSGSWVLDGFLRHIATLGDDAPLVWAVPLTNIDGVEQGDYGKDNFPYDLNRAWGRPPMRHEVLVFQNDMRRWRDRCKPVLGIDFHAPGACESSGVYAYIPDPNVDRAAHDVVKSWSDRTQATLSPKYAAEDFARVARYPSRWETPSFRSYGWYQLGVPCITYENPYAMVGDHVLTIEDYREIGARIAKGVVGAL
ncbi:MAG: hypothetical protein ACP5JG_05415 [Anaerolineae bacterium]